MKRIFLTTLLLIGVCTVGLTVALAAETPPTNVEPFTSPVSTWPGLTALTITEFPWAIGDSSTTILPPPTLALWNSLTSLNLAGNVPPDKHGTIDLTLLQVRKPWEGSSERQYLESLPLEESRWVREWSTAWTSRPFTGMNLTGDLNYQQPLTQPIVESHWRLALRLLAASTNVPSLHSNYVYFYNPVAQSQTHFHDLSTTVQLPYDIQLDGAAERVSICGTTSNTSIRWKTGLRRHLGKELELSALISRERRQEHLAHTDTIDSTHSSLKGRLVTTYTASPQVTLTGGWDWTDITDQVGSDTSVLSEQHLGFGFEYIHNRGKLQYKVDYRYDHTHDHLTHNLTWIDQIGPLHYTYIKELTHDQTHSFIQFRKEALDLEWVDEQLPFHPSMQWDYQKKNEDGEFWEKQKIMARISYTLSQYHALTGELGYLATQDYAEPKKTFESIYIKLGTEYTF